MNPFRLSLSVLFLMGIGRADTPTTSIVNIVYLGDSITAGATLPPGAPNPPSICTQILQDTLQKRAPDMKIYESNQGHGGHTTVDFLPSTNTDLPQAEKAAQQLETAHPEAGFLIFSILLGTNDSAVKGPLGAPVSPEQFRTNLTAIIDQLQTDFPRCRIFIHEPIWYSPNTHNSATYEQEGLDRLNRYVPVIEEVVSVENQKYYERVFLGDTKAHAYFHLHYQQELTPEQGVKGTFYLHPNATGAASLGHFWADAILAAHLSLNTP